jgi:zinc protease
VEALTRDDAYAFYRRFYHPGNAVLAIVGDVAADDALASVRARFGGVPSGRETGAVRAVEPPQDGERRVVVRKPGPHARVTLAFRAPALSEPDFPALILLDALLAGGKGAYFTREYPKPADAPLRVATLGAGLATDAGTKWQASAYPYVYTLSAAAASERELPALEAALQGVLREAETRVWTDAELATALRQVRTGWALDLDDQAGRAHQLAFFEACGGYRSLFELPDRIARVTREELRRFVLDRLQPWQATVGWFVPTPGGTVFAGTPQPARTVPASRQPHGPPGASSAGARAPAGPPQALTLPNGMRVILAPHAGAGLVALRGRVHAGSRFEAPGRAGSSALATEWLASAAPREPAGAPSLRFTLHAEPGSATNADFIEFAAAGLADDVRPLLEVLAGRLSREAPAGDEWEKVRRAALERCRRRNDSDDGALALAAREELFPAGSALRSPAWGDEAALLAAEPLALRGFLGENVRPSRTTVVLAGDFEPAAVREALSATLGRWSDARRKAPHPPVTPRPRTAAGWRERFLLRPGTAQDEIRVVWPGDRSRRWDRAATEALLYLLGETGYAGRLGSALVGPGLVYSVEATLEEAGAPGFLLIRTAAAPEHTPEVLRRIRRVVETAAEGGFQQAELDEALAYRRGKATRSREGALALAETLLAESSPARAAEEKVDLARLNDTARRLLRNGGPLALVAGPGASASDAGRCASRQSSASVSPN